MRLYVSGPMTGYEYLNFPAFESAAKTLRDIGFDVVSPNEVENDQDDWDTCLKNDIREMLTCDAIATLSGWEASRGARLETAIAIMVGMAVRPVEDYINGALMPDKQQVLVIIRDTPAGLRAQERLQAVYDAGGGSEDSALYWMQVAYEFLLDQEEAKGA